jgi:single-stranded DNA-binding protein
MATSKNSWQGAGYIVSDVKCDEAGRCTFKLAVEREGKAGSTPKVDYIPISCLGSQKDFIKMNAKKGTNLSITGRLQTWSEKKAAPTEEEIKNNDLWDLRFVICVKSVSISA